MTRPWTTFVAVTALACATGSCSSEDGSDNVPAEESTSASQSQDADEARSADDAKNEDEDQDQDQQDSDAEKDEQVASDGDEAKNDQAEKQAKAQKQDAANPDHTKDIRGLCDLKTQFPDDHACMPAPDPSEGMQIHIGPSNYDDPDEVAKFIMHPGEESSECFTFRTTNKEQVVYQTWALSGRAGTHHIITTTYDGDLPTGDFGPCNGRRAEGVMQTGSLPGASKAYMPRSKVAPEYENVGQRLDAEALVQADMHYYNFTDEDILREVWVNLYYAPQDTVTEYADVIRGFGGLSWYNEPIEPGTDKVYKYECPITGDGNILNLLGHYHSHGKRFTASIQRKSGDIEKVFEMYDYLEPAIFDYNSVVDNPAFSDVGAGATSGILKVQDGDVLLWECHIVNDSMVGLRYTNEVVNGEMCNVWGYSIGSDPIVCDIQ